MGLAISRRTCGGETDRNSNVMQDQASKTSLKAG